jgi:cell division septation protein DedD
MRTTVTNLPAPSPVDADRPAAASGPKPVTLPSTTASATPAPASSTSAPPAGQTTPAQPSAAAQPAAGSETAAPVSLEKIELPPENLPAAGAAPAQGAFYSIQLIAFSSANKAKADAYAKDVRENAGLDVELETSPDGKLIRLYVGRYADREGAVKACLELKKQARFSQAFVPQEARKAGS